MDVSALSALKTYAAARKAIGNTANLQADITGSEAKRLNQPADGLPPVPPISSNIVEAAGVRRAEMAGTEASQPLMQSAEKFIDIFKNAEVTATDFTIGKADAQAVVEALASAEVALETAVTIRNRVVEAYQEILRMPV